MKITRLIMRQRRNKGFYLIGLLIALMIIMILTGRYMGGTKDDPAPAKLALDRSKASACAANRVTLESSIQMWMVSHMGEIPDFEKLRAANYSIPRCPEGGEYTITPEYKIHCSIHSE